MVVTTKLLEFFQKKFTLSFFLVAPSILGPFTFIVEHFKVLGCPIVFGL